MISVPCSIGELIDKITILEIKKESISDPTKLNNVYYELGTLYTLFSSQKFHETISNVAELYEMMGKLREVNKKLWGIEDEIRVKERNGEFDEEFIHLARSVYHLNDKRSVIKKEINVLTNSSIVEEKDYEQYASGNGIDI